MAAYNMSRKEICFWTKTAVPSEPHEEYIPWLCLFRPLSHNNQTWVLYWPELEI